ncbi:MAG: TatD family hydrolase [Planctomycetes bacterium]|nr:TatD family hydrolase [Planctomycetota bacterium]
MLVDTHCHLTYDDLAPRIDDVLARAAAAGVRRCITIATSIADARKAIDLVRTHSQVWMAAGIHPHEAGRATAEDVAALRDLHEGRFDGSPQAGRLVAVGETGLDFHYDFAPRDRQEDVFRSQLHMACDVGRPVIIHARKSEALVCDILAEYPALRDRVVFHCFSGGPDLARRIIDSGWWVSFTGVVTFANADEIRESAKAAPADRFMVETDAPYLSPIPVRKVRPCEPAFVRHTAEFLANLRGVPLETLARQTTGNAERFFGLPRSRS